MSSTLLTVGGLRLTVSPFLLVPDWGGSRAHHRTGSLARCAVGSVQSCRDRGNRMTKASWIVVVAAVILSNFAGAAEWPQFRGPNSSGIGDGKPPVEFDPRQNV